MKKLNITSLKARKYYDRDMIMIHAAFQILTDFVEKEFIHNGVNVRGKYIKLRKCKNKTLKKYSVSEVANLTAYNAFIKETWTLYRWWKKRIQSERGDKKVKGKYINDNGQFYSDIEDQDMLERLLKIRMRLWT